MLEVRERFGATNYLSLQNFFTVSKNMNEIGNKKHKLNINRTDYGIVSNFVSPNEEKINTLTLYNNAYIITNTTTTTTTTNSNN